MGEQSKRQRLSALHEEKGAQFHECFPSELNGLLEIYRLLQIDIRACNICCSNHVELLENHRMLKCNDCGECVWLTKGTFFERMKQPKLWLMPIWFENEGVVLNSSQLSILSGAVYSSAHNVMTKFCFAKARIASERDGEHVSSVECIRIVKRRSRETPARMVPKAEEWALEEMTWAEDESNSSTDEELIAKAVAKLSCDELDIYNLLSDVPIGFDNICGLSGKPHGIVSASLTILEMAGLAQEFSGMRFKQSVPKLGPRANICTSDVSAETQISIDAFVEYILEKFDGISRKYLELYIANCWFHRNWCDELKGEFLRTLRSCGPIKHQQILAFVTPRQVKFCKPIAQLVA